MEALFVVDRHVWTSAGVTTGIDMALAMADADLSRPIANDVARQLVLYERRPGNQSQFSSLLKAQRDADAAFSDLIQWIGENLTKRLDVPALAAKAGMSERTFYRRFTGTMGATPANFVESLRLDAARALLDRGETQKRVALATGFGSATRMSLAFERRFGLRPALFTRLHSPPK